MIPSQYTPNLTLLSNWLDLGRRHRTKLLSRQRFSWYNHNNSTRHTHSNGRAQNASTTPIFFGRTIEEVLSLGLVRSRPKGDEEPPPSSCIIVVLMMDEPKFIPPHQISPLRMAQNSWHPGSHAPRVISSLPPSSPNTWRLPKISIHFPSELEQEMLSQRAVHPSRICCRNLLSACHFLLMDNGLLF